MEKNWDPQVRSFFIRITNSIARIVGWIMLVAITGIYLEWGDIYRKPAWHPILFYAFALGTFLLLIRYLVRSWKKD